MKGVWFGLLFFTGISANGQTFAEWFQQTKTEKKYYLQQIAALAVYTAELEKGYGIVESGLNSIRDIKSGEFTAHSRFYDGLSGINPVIGSMGELADIVGLQAAMVERFSSAMNRYRQGTGLKAGELDYLSSVYGLVLDEGLADVNLLLMVVTAGSVKMTDEERLACIRELDGRVKERFVLTVVLTDRADLLCKQRQMVGASVGTVKRLYGVP